ncbi:MAG: protein kinase [Gemmatimonadota bacterium]|nr:protein kinase [Gemmatimonadota bacterium]
MTVLEADLRAALHDQYAIEREVGRGGMAVVFLARDLKHGRQVAVKALRPEIAVTLGSERFLREIAIAAGLNHPHIVPLFDSGEIDDLLYYVMPFIDGESLRVRLSREQTLPLDDALTIGRQVASALGHAHGKGVIHRDIKPENVLLSGGEAVVTDFGIARAISAAGQHITLEGLVVGTLGYMSPEQAFGGRDIDGRSDLYGLGCVLYEMLVGHAPGRWVHVPSTTTSTIPNAPASDREQLDMLPRGMERVLLRALAAEPDERFGSAAEFMEALMVRDARPGRPALRSIAVLPFVNLSSDQNDEYFSDGITEEITNALTKVRALRVAARTSAFVYKGKEVDVRNIGRALDVDAVLEGSVRRAGDRIRIGAQLVEAIRGKHLWSERYDRELADVFAIQDEIAENIAHALRVVLSEDEREAMARVATDDVQAYDYYLRGRQFLHQFRRKSLAFARQMFERAIEIDPHYALAYAGVADCHAILHMHWGGDASELAAATKASERALELDPALPEAHSSAGLVLLQQGKLDQARAEFETAMRLDPSLYEPRYFYARACFQRGQTELAAQLFESAAAAREDYPARFFAAQSHAALGRQAEAESSYRRALEVVKDHLALNPDDARALTMGAVAYCRTGDREEGLRWAERAVAVDPEDGGIAYNVACLYALEGEPDKAIRFLEHALGAGFGNRDWLERDPDLESLRDDPRFQRLLDGMER